jgi:hypothetical protein
VHSSTADRQQDVPADHVALDYAELQQIPVVYEWNAGRVRCRTRETTRLDLRHQRLIATKQGEKRIAVVGGPQYVHDERKAGRTGAARAVPRPGRQIEAANYPDLFGDAPVYRAAARARGKPWLERRRGPKSNSIVEGQRFRRKKGYVHDSASFDGVSRPGRSPVAPYQASVARTWSYGCRRVPGVPLVRFVPGGLRAPDFGVLGFSLGFGVGFVAMVYFSCGRGISRTRTFLNIKEERAVLRTPDLEAGGFHGT